MSLEPQTHSLLTGAHHLCHPVLAPVSMSVEVHSECGVLAMILMATIQRQVITMYGILREAMYATAYMKVALHYRTTVTV